MSPTDKILSPCSRILLQRHRGTGANMALPPAAPVKPLIFVQDGEACPAPTVDPPTGAPAPDESSAAAPVR
jgi:hypothetical protein